MQYLLTPLHAHFDAGFGATGNAFYDAAESLDGSKETMKGNLFNANLPVNFLYRHAIELFLKSAIVILHRRFNLPYGAAASDSEPMVLVGATWKPFNKVHSISLLWTYVEQLFLDHAAWLAEHPKPEVWKFSESIDQQVQTIEAGDPRSTFFRYPTTKNIKADAAKSSMKEVSEASFIEAMTKSSDADPKGFGMIVKDDDGGFVKGYVYEDESGEALNQALRQAAQYFYNLHAAMRWEICGGA